MQTLPRPGKTVLSHHGHLHMFAVGQLLISRKGVRQVQGHVLPIAADVDRDLNAVKERQQVPLFPPLIVQGMLSGD